MKFSVQSEIIYYFIIIFNRLTSAVFHANLLNIQLNIVRICIILIKKWLFVLKIAIIMSRKETQRQLIDAPLVKIFGQIYLIFLKIYRNFKMIVDLF